MRDVFASAASWIAESRAFAIATLVDVHDAAPAPPGSSMAVSGDGLVAGDIGAGCYEREIVEEAIAAAEDGRTRYLRIELTSDDLLAGANGCGGTLEIVIWRPGPDFAATADEIVRARHEVHFSIPFERDGGAAAYHAFFPPRRALAIVGATALAAEIAVIADRLEFRSIIVDPRPAFATQRRLAAAEIELAWPDDVLPGLLNAQTPLLILSHDPKFDVPALRAGLRSASPYIGLLGSRRAQESRRALLRAEGFDDDALARIHGPVGLDLGGATVAETAVSIVAEIVAATHGRAGGSLRRHDGAIHDAVAIPAAC